MHKLEVIAFDIASCSIIQRSGAHRIELCQGPAEGGTTPSHGFIKAARQQTSIQLYPIIRPRGGDFLYSADEFTMMRSDVVLCKELGCDGVVLGILTADGQVDKERCSRLVELAYPMGVTFHRAFDRVVDAATALEDVINCGFERILTSGLQPDAISGATTIADLIQQADNRITIMPGSGVRSGNIAALAAQTGAVEFHTSARINQNSQMVYHPTAMQENLQHASVDEMEIANCLAALKSHFTL
jgi:copper homeostasis protein